MSVCLTKTIHIRKGRMHDDALRDEELSREEIRSDPIYLTLYKECQKKAHSPKIRAFLDWIDLPEISLGVCEECGHPLELSEGWVPSHNDPSNSGMAPVAEPLCFACAKREPA